MQYLNQEEKDKLSEFKQVVVWGYPLHTHTQSYLHAMWVKFFKHLGKRVYWFHDKDFDRDLNYTNTLFITEGYGDENIPLVENSVYFVNFCINPKKYLDKGCRVIDIRFNVDEMHDCNYDFNLKDGKHNLVNLSEETRYEKLKNDDDLHPSKRKGNMDYEAIYMYWATDLTPEEIDLEMAEKRDDMKKNIIYYIGSPHSSRNFNDFRLACKWKKISIRNINPWSKPVSFEENMKLMRQSILSPDFRPTGTDDDVKEYGVKNGKNHLEIGYLPCRVLKTISYGRLGITDSKKVKDILGNHVLYNDNMKELLDEALTEKDNIERIKKAMTFVKDHHTYVQRIRDMMRALIN